MTNQRKILRQALSLLRIFERNRRDIAGQSRGLSCERCPTCGARSGEFHRKPCLGR